MRLPLMLDVSGRRVLVVGGGTVATRRVRRLSAAGAQVTVVAPAMADDIVDLPVTVERRAFEATDVAGAWLVLACTDSAEVNRAVADAAEREQIWCVRADRASESSAWLTASTTVDDTTVAVSAAADPGRAVELRDHVEQLMRRGDIHARPHRSSRNGSVTLVGGGPGDPDLLTLRAHRALLDADIVVTDRLGPVDALKRLSDQVQIVDVGKDPRGHAASQDDINELLIREARAGMAVVRLKGGDPFVLGRGTEEVDALVEAGVPVTVVPGVTSATAAATLAGIALTERGTAQQFTVVSGHVPPGDARSTVDWDALGAGSGTLVVLMTVSNLGAIAGALIAGGRDAATPAAVVANASLPDQKVVRDRLDRIAETSEREAIVPPAIAVIGEVVRLQ